MEVLWWLAPAAGATVVAMLWAGWLGRQRDDKQRDDSEAALARMEAALARVPRHPPTRLGSPTSAEPSHGVAVRGSARRPQSRQSTAR